MQLRSAPKITNTEETSVKSESDSPAGSESDASSVHVAVGSVALAAPSESIVTAHSPQDGSGASLDSANFLSQLFQLSSHPPPQSATPHEHHHMEDHPALSFYLSGPTPPTDDRMSDVSANPCSDKLPEEVANRFLHQVTAQGATTSAEEIKQFSSNLTTTLLGFFNRYTLEIPPELFEETRQHEAVYKMLDYADQVVRQHPLFLNIIQDNLQKHLVYLASAVSKYGADLEKQHAHATHLATVALEVPDAVLDNALFASDKNNFIEHQLYPLLLKLPHVFLHTTPPRRLELMQQPPNYFILASELDHLRSSYITPALNHWTTKRTNDFGERVRKYTAARQAQEQAKVDQASLKLRIDATSVQHNIILAVHHALELVVNHFQTILKPIKTYLDMNVQLSMASAYHSSDSIKVVLPFSRGNLSAMIHHLREFKNAKQAPLMMEDLSTLFHIPRFSAAVMTVPLILTPLQTLETMYDRFVDRSHMHFLTVDMIMSIRLVDIYPLGERLTERLTKQLSTLVTAHYDKVLQDPTARYEETDFFVQLSKIIREEHTRLRNLAISARRDTHVIGSGLPIAISAYGAAPSGTTSGGAGPNPAATLPAKTTGKRLPQLQPPYRQSFVGYTPIDYTASKLTTVIPSEAKRCTTVPLRMNSVQLKPYTATVQPCAHCFRSDGKVPPEPHVPQCVTKLCKGCGLYGHHQLSCHQALGPDGKFAK